MSSEFPQIQASDPSVVEVPVATQTQQVTYDRWWMAKLIVSADDPNAPARAGVRLVKGRRLADGEWELSRRPEDTVSFTMPDLFALAAGDPVLAGVLAGVLERVAAYGAAQGVL